MRGPIIFAVAATVALSACDRADTAQPLSEQVIHAKDTAELDAAHAEAVKTLPVFWSKFYAKAPELSEFAIKVELPTPDGGSEAIWAEPIREAKDEVVVRLLNDGERLPLKFGAEVRAPAAKIWDWTYTKDGKAYGHFTTRVLLKQATPDQRAQAEGMFSPTPLEAKAE